MLNTLVGQSCGVLLSFIMPGEVRGKYQEKENVVVLLVGEITQHKVFRTKRLSGETEESME